LAEKLTRRPEFLIVKAFDEHERTQITKQVEPDRVGIVLTNVFINPLLAQPLSRNRHRRQRSAFHTSRRHLKISDVDESIFYTNGWTGIWREKKL
jgi:hypothetical protein